MWWDLRVGPEACSYLFSISNCLSVLVGIDNSVPMNAETNSVAWLLAVLGYAERGISNILNHD